MKERTRIVVGIYIRVSTQEQAAEGYSISEQHERLVKYSEAQDWIVYKVYSDPGFSGGSMERPGLRSLIRDASAGKLDKVVVYKLDRLSRSQKDTLYLIEDVFLENKVDFVSMTENFDTGTPLGRAMIGILSVFAQLEREQIKERMSVGREGRAKSGLWHGSNRVPIGYRYKDGKLEIEPYEAEIVRRIYREFNEGKTVASIVSAFKREGVTTSYGVITDGTIKSVLQSYSNIGVIVHNGVEYDGQHEAIVEREEFEKAKRRFQYQKENDLLHFNFTKHASIVTGLCYCGECKKKMLIVHRKKTGAITSADRLLTCPEKKITGCTNRRYPLEMVEDLILAEIRKLKLDRDYLREARSKTQINTAAERLSILEDRIKGNKTKISRLMDLYTVGGIDLADIKEKIEALTLESATLSEEVERLKDQTEETISDEEIVDLAALIEDPEKARNVVKKLIKRIEFSGDTVTITWSF